MNSQRVNEWYEYFRNHCYLPAGAIVDLFEYIAELEASTWASNPPSTSTKTSSSDNSE